MRTLYIATSFKPKVAEKDSLVHIEETSLARFKNALIVAGEAGYQIKFAVTISAATERLVKKLNIPVGDGEIVGKAMGSEEVKRGDIILLASAVKIDKFRYFIITLHSVMKKKCRRCTINEQDGQTIGSKKTK